MKKRDRQAVRRYHDRVAGRYDSIYDDAFWKWHNALTWAYLRPYVPGDQRAAVADLGCGTGVWGLRLLKSGFAVTFVDISAGMLEQVRRKAAEMGQEGRARFVQADVQEMGELETGAYALATAFGEPVGSAARPAKALKEIRRILADDGVLVATFDNRLAGMEYYLESGDTSELQSFLRSGRTHWLTRDREERFELHTFTPGQVRALLEKASFAVLSLVGKTVLPMRAYRTLLEDGPTARRLMRIEKQLARDEDAIGRAPHIQAAARAAKSR